MISAELLAYADHHSNVNAEDLTEIERSTHLHTLAPQMLSGRIQGKLLTLITSLSCAQNVLEIGTFTAYGTACLAKGLSSPQGKVVTMEENPEHEYLIQKHLSIAGVADRVEVVIGDALQLIPKRDEAWDLVYIDAHKQEYIQYYEAVIDRVRAGGIILTDNVLWSGKVVNEPNDKDAKVINAYNEMLAGDPRVDVMILTIRDGLSVAVRR